LIRIAIDTLLMSLLLLIGWIVIGGGQVITLGSVTLGLRSIQNPSFLFLLLLALRLLSFPTQFWQRPRRELLFWALKSVLFLLLSVVVVKTAISLLDEFYFGRNFDFIDWAVTYSIDLSFVFVFAGLLLALGLLCLINRHKSQSQTAMARAPHRTIYVLLTLLGFICTAAGAFYVLLGYTYFEWGSFIEPHHVQAIHKAGVGAEFNDLFLRSYTVAAVCLVIGLYWLSGKIIASCQRRNLNPLVITTGLMTILMPALFTYNAPLGSPANYAPTVQSPLLMLLNPIAENSDGIEDIERLNTVSLTDYNPYPKRDIKAKYHDLLSAAKGFNVVFYVMESVRRQSLSHYGYERETMPTLTQLIGESLVFDNAYVMQPRSSKAMSALALGVMPDPRLRPLSWNPERIVGQDTLFKRLMADNRRFYIGTAQPYGGDNLQKFFIETAGNKQQAVISHEDLVKDASVANDDVGLSQHFNRWVAKDDQPFVGLLWTECAHIPYLTEETPFGTSRVIDKYDNCLRQVDRGLNELISGLRSNGQLNNTLLVVFGDHGEALGEKFDRGHGSYLYEHSMRIPFFISNPVLFKQARQVNARFQLKDVPSTVLSLLGLPSALNQSENIFSKSSDDPIYMSNVYQDYKIGMIEGTHKYVYRPRFETSFYYNLQTDPNENDNIVSELSQADLSQKQAALLRWYKFQTQYIERRFPRKK
jgi:glucan phosphoethanolaminetransferase (alkaline phosphatase superfamily)